METLSRLFATEETPITACLIMEEARAELLFRHFDRYSARVEDAVYACMRRLSTQYRSGVWQFYELSNGGLYLAPQLNREQLWLHAKSFMGPMSLDAAGITACLFAFTYLSWGCSSDTFASHAALLRTFAHQHAEAQKIIAAMIS